MKLVVGLGNPGRRYADTRHNVGFRVVAAFAARHGIEGRPEDFGGVFGRGALRCGDERSLEVGVLQPQTFMNRSGEVVAAAMRRFGIAAPGDLVVVYDDVDLPFGKLRVRPSGGSAGHRGVADIIAKVGSSDFPRLRFGVDRPPGIDTAEYVLQDFCEAEEAALETALGTAADALAAILCDGTTPAMNRYNRRDPVEE